jgi:hypothetical protein
VTTVDAHPWYIKSCILSIIRDYDCYSASCSGESNFNSNDSTNLKRNLEYESGSKAGIFDEKTEVENLALLCL